MREERKVVQKPVGLNTVTLLRACSKGQHVRAIQGIVWDPDLFHADPGFGYKSTKYSIFIIAISIFISMIMKNKSS